MREHNGVKQMLALWNDLETARRQLDDNRELAASTDAELAQMAQEEIPALEKRVADLERDFQIALLPPDENENRDAIVEIRAGTGGSEAAIFAADLYDVATGAAKPIYQRPEEFFALTYPTYSLRDLATRLWRL